MKRNLATLLIYRLYWFCFQSHTIFIYLLVLEPQSILLYNFVFSFTGYFRMWSTSEGLRLVLHTPQLEEPFPTQIQDKRFLISCYPRMCLVFFITQEHCWLIPDLSETPSFSSARPPPCPACNPAHTVWCRAVLLLLHGCIRLRSASGLTSSFLAGQVTPEGSPAIFCGHFCHRQPFHLKKSKSYSAPRTLNHEQFTTHLSVLSFRSPLCNSALDSHCS